MLLPRIPLFIFFACTLLHRSSVAAIETPIEYANNLVWIQVEAEGAARKLNFILDSGAGRSVIESDVAARLNLRVRRPTSVLGINGNATANEVTGFRGVAVGQPMPASLMAMDLKALGQVCGRRIDGLLGLDFFRHRIVEIDYGSRLLRVLSRDEFVSRHGEMLPLAARNDALCAKVALDGGVAQWLRLDTGCTSALEWVAASEKASRRGFATIALNGTQGRVRRADATIGERQIAGVEVQLHSQELFPGEAGLIGNGLLSRFTLTLDADRRRCRLAE